LRHSESVRHPTLSNSPDGFATDPSGSGCRVLLRNCYHGDPVAATLCGRLVQLNDIEDVDTTWGFVGVELGFEDQGLKAIGRKCEPQPSAFSGAAVAEETLNVFDDVFDNLFGFVNDFPQPAVTLVRILVQGYVLDRAVRRLEGQVYTQTQSPLSTLTLLDALERAQRLDPQFQSAVSDAKLAREDRLQSRAAPFPTLGLSSQYLNGQGNGLIPTGRYITQDGVHVYREWSVVRQDLSPATLARTDYKRATVAEALSQSKAAKARLALAVTVVKAYYGLLVAHRSPRRTGCV